MSHYKSRLLIISNQQYISYVCIVCCFHLVIHYLAVFETRLHASDYIFKVQFVILIKVFLKVSITFRIVCWFFLRQYLRIFSQMKSPWICNRFNWPSRMLINRDFIKKYLQYYWMPAYNIRIREIWNWKIPQKIQNGKTTSANFDFFRFFSFFCGRISSSVSFADFLPRTSTFPTRETMTSYYFLTHEQISQQSNHDPVFIRRVNNNNNNKCNRRSVDIPSCVLSIPSPAPSSSISISSCCWLLSLPSSPESLSDSDSVSFE